MRATPAMPGGHQDGCVTGHDVTHGSIGGETGDNAQKMLRGLGSAAEFVQGVGTVDPALRIVRHQFREGGGDIQRTGSLPTIRVNLPADGQYVRMGAEFGSDVIKFCIRLQGRAKLKPALVGEEMVRVGRSEGRHGRGEATVSCALHGAKNLGGQQAGSAELVRKVKLAGPDRSALPFVHPQRHQFEVGNHVFQFRYDCAGDDVVHAQLFSDFALRT